MTQLGPTQRSDEQDRIAKLEEAVRKIAKFSAIVLTHLRDEAVAVQDFHFAAECRAARDEAAAIAAEFKQTGDQ